MSNHLRVSINLHEPDLPFASNALSVYEGLDGNAAYTNPPIPLSTFKATIDSFNSAIAAAYDGGKTAIIQRNQIRENLATMIRQLGHWVEANCKNDLATLKSSGFQPVSITRTPAQPLEVPIVLKVDNGQSSGILWVRIKPVFGALSYEVQYSSPAASGGLGPWILCPPFPNSRSLFVKGLTPGTAYTIQVRALGKLGYTEWSASINRIAV
jgi:hypothetical protein